MRDRTAILQRCTAQRGNGSFCDYYAAPDMPFPICEKHALQVFHRLYEANTSKVRAIRASFDESLKSRDTTPAEQRRTEQLRLQAEQSVVYYVRIGEHIKIGFSSNLKQRLGSLRVSASAVMATEPGGRELESQRHKMFAEERVSKREDFNPSRRLLEHIKAVRARHGDPTITSYVKP